MDKKTVLITGCSQGGLGEAMARAFHDKGFYVFATLRNTTKAGSLAQLPDVEILELEVTSTESIERAAEAVAKRTGGTLDVLVNNAGADFVTPLLDVSLVEVKNLYDLNVWSILATTQAFSKLLIKSKGSICNICSTAACMPFAYAGIYSSSKVAAKQLSETLRIELRPLGVKVTTGLIGAINTPIHDNAAELNLPERSYYQCVRETIIRQKKGEMKPGSEQPEVTAKNIVNDIIAGKSGVIWRGGMASIIRYLAGWVPWLLEYLANENKDLDVVKKVHIRRTSSGEL